MPCENCSRRGLGLSCTFQHIRGTDDSSSRTNSSPLLDQGEASASLATIQNKVDQLESLIVAFMGQRDVSVTGLSNTHQSSSAVVSGPSGQKESVTKIDIPVNEAPATMTPSEPLKTIDADNERTAYSEGSHWSAILDGVRLPRIAAMTWKLIMIFSDCGSASSARQQ